MGLIAFISMLNAAAIAANLPPAPSGWDNEEEWNNNESWTNE